MKRFIGLILLITLLSCTSATPPFVGEWQCDGFQVKIEKNGDSYLFTFRGARENSTIPMKLDHGVLTSVGAFVMATVAYKVPTDTALVTLVKGSSECKRTP